MACQPNVMPLMKSNLVSYRQMFRRHVPGLVHKSKDQLQRDHRITSDLGMNVLKETRRVMFAS